MIHQLLTDIGNVPTSTYVSLAIIVTAGAVMFVVALRRGHLH